jgi:hypothetical protein
MLRLDTSKGRADIINAAMTEVGSKIREVGKNAGARVEQYQKIVHIPKGAPWCAAFVSWSTAQGLGMPKPPKWGGGGAVGLYHKGAGALKKLGMNDYCATHEERHKVKPGWVFSQARNAEDAKKARKGAYTLGHTGVVVGLDPNDPDVFITAEGNTNEAGAREGDGVYQKRRKFSDAKMVGFFDPVAATVAQFKPEQLAALEAGQGVDFAKIDTSEEDARNALAQNEAEKQKAAGGGGGLFKLAIAAAGVYLMTKV